MFWISKRIVFPVALCLLLGCNRSPEVIPETPDGTVQAVIDGLGDNQPQVVWDALPAGYQADVRELISTFSTHMDASLYDRVFRIFGKAVKILEVKEDYIFNSPMALNTPLIESGMGNNWKEIVRILNTLVKSDLSTLQSLSQMDPGEFFASTGHKVMEDLENLMQRSQRSSSNNPWKMLEQAQIEFVKATDDQASLKFVISTNSVQEIDMARVEGRWVPADMAATWNEGVAKAKQGMENLNSPEFKKAIPMVSMILASAEGIVESLLKSGSQKEFDELLKSLSTVGAMFQSFQSQGEK
ncbi:MAG TPA: hypothetical protein EYQ50_23850 [Verrucomicrobiales bacterium]|nr:hypothetical protein [Verrucomicrobiales bacterium]HIL72362.1 hypothetical protein [Verrucomicrobiota bacterium]